MTAKEQLLEIISECLGEDGMDSDDAAYYAEMIANAIIEYGWPRKDVD